MNSLRIFTAVRGDRQDVSLAEVALFSADGQEAIVGVEAPGSDSPAGETAWPYLVDGDLDTKRRRPSK